MGGLPEAEAPLEVEVQVAAQVPLEVAVVQEVAVLHEVEVLLEVVDRLIVLLFEGVPCSRIILVQFPKFTRSNGPLVTKIRVASLRFAMCMRVGTRVGLFSVQGADSDELFRSRARKLLSFDESSRQDSNPVGSTSLEKLVKCTE